VELRKAFAAVDKDGDGIVSYNVQEAGVTAARLQEARAKEDDWREARTEATIDAKRTEAQAGMKTSDMRDKASIRSANYALLAKGKFGAAAGKCTVHVVDGAKDEPHKFLYSSLYAALRHAKAGDTILVCPGTYNEYRTLAVTKAVTIDALKPQPKGSPPTVIFEGANEEVLVWQAAGGRVANIGFSASSCCAARFQCFSPIAVEVDNCSFESDSDSAGASVVIAAGNVKMRECQVNGPSAESEQGLFGTALLMTGSASVTLSANQIKGGVVFGGRARAIMNGNSLTSSCAAGLMITGGLSVTMEDDTVSEHKLECVNVCDESVSVSMSRCRIFGGQSVGVSVCSGSVEMTNCEVYDHAGPCVLFSGGGVRASSCDIHSGKSAGVLVMGDGTFVLSDTALRGNGGSGLDIMSGSPTTTKCCIYDNCGCGIQVRNDGTGCIADGEIRTNGLCAAMVSAGGSPTIRGNTISDGKGSALIFSGKGTAGMAEGNTITGFAVGVETTLDANPTVNENVVSECAQYGFLLHSRGAGSFDNNTVEQCEQGGVRVESGATPLLTSNTLRFNHVVGIFVCGRGTAGDYAGNQVSNTQGTGIIIQDGAEPSMKDNVLINQNGVGLHAGAGSVGTYEGGRIHSNRGHGVLMDGDTCMTVSGVNISANESPSAIYVTGEARGQLVSNTVSRAPHAGVVVSGPKARPVLLRNDVTGCGGVGILIQAQAEGIYQENKVRRSTLSGIEVCEQANPTVRANVVTHSKRNGILIHRGALGEYLENEVGNSHGVGVMVLCGDPLVRANTVHSGKATGILVSNRARGRLEGNTFAGHTYAAITLSDGADPVLKGNHVENSETVGLLVQGDAAGTLEGNRVECCDGQGIKVIGASASPMVLNNVVCKCGVGILVSDKSKLAVVDGNDITEVSQAGILITEGAAPTVVRNKVHHIVRVPGILIDTQAAAGKSGDSGGDSALNSAGSSRTDDQAVEEMLAQLSMELDQQEAMVQRVCVSDNRVHMATAEGWSVVVKKGSIAQVKCNTFENGFPGGIDDEEGSEVEATDNEWHGPTGSRGDSAAYMSAAEMAAAEAALKKPVVMDEYLQLIHRTSNIVGAAQEATAVPKKTGVSVYNRLNFMQQ
jgi:parallel beta-helix repeat protein